MAMPLSYRTYSAFDLYPPKQALRIGLEKDVMEGATFVETNPRTIAIDTVARIMSSIISEAVLSRIIIDAALLRVRITSS